MGSVALTSESSLLRFPVGVGAGAAHPPKKRSGACQVELHGHERGAGRKGRKKGLTRRISQEAEELISDAGCGVCVLSMRQQQFYDM